MHRYAFVGGSPAPAPDAVECGQPRSPHWLARQRLTIVSAVVAALLLGYLTALLTLAGATVWLALDLAAFAKVLPWPVVGTALGLLLCAGTLVGTLLLAKGVLHIRREPLALAGVAPHSEPDLAMLIAYIAEQVEAPVPARLEFDCGTEIGVRFDGLAGFLGNRLVVRLGASAVAGLTVQELTALVAGALAAYGRRSGARRIWLIENANRLLARAATGDDPFDRWLAAHTRGRFRLAASMARRLLTLSEAARHEVGWLQRRVADVSESSLAAHRALREAWAHHLSGANPGALRSRLNSLRAAAVETSALVRHGWQAGQSLPASLPDTIARNARGRRTSAAGLPARTPFSCNAPANLLFRDFARLGRRLTLPCYRLQFELPVGPAALDGEPLPAHSAGQHLLEGGWLPFVPLGFAGAPHQGAAGAGCQLAERWNNVRRELVSDLETETLADAGLLEGLKATDIDTVRRRCREHEEQLADLGGRITASLQPAVRRLTTAAKQAGEERLLKLLTRTDALLPGLWELRLNLNALELLLIESQRRRGSRLADRVGERRRDVLSALVALRVALRNTPYPLPDPVRRSLERYVLPRRPDENLGACDLLEMGEIALGRILSVRWSALERLAVAASR